MKKENLFVGSIAGLCLVPAVFAAVDYIKVAREERAKRSKIETWEQEMVALVWETHARTMEKINDRDVPLDEAWTYMMEQRDFVNQIISNPPL